MKTEMEKKLSVVNVAYFGVICKHLSRRILEPANTVAPSLTRIQLPPRLPEYKSVLLVGTNPPHYLYNSD